MWKGTEHGPAGSQSWPYLQVEGEGERRGAIREYLHTHLSIHPQTVHQFPPSTEQEQPLPWLWDLSLGCFHELCAEAWVTHPF